MMHCSAYRPTILYRIVAAILCAALLLQASPASAGPAVSYEPPASLRAAGVVLPVLSTGDQPETINQQPASTITQPVANLLSVADLAYIVEPPAVGLIVQSPPSVAQAATPTATPTTQPSPGEPDAVPQDILPPGQTEVAPPPRVETPPQLPQPPFTALLLLPGWNLLSLPKTATATDPATILAPLDGHYRQLFAYDACDATDPWKRYDPTDPTGSDLTVIDPKIGFWIEASSAVTLPLTGAIPPTTTIQLCAGWNLIGLPLAQPRPVGNALASIAGKYSRVFGYDPTDSADPWEVYDVTAPVWANDLQLMQPGRGYWVLATENTTLFLANQGAPPQVQLLSPSDRATQVTSVTFLTDVVGTVRSDLLQSWSLSYRLHGETVRTPFATGVTPVLSDTLGSFDPTLLLNGTYEIQLTATDYLGRSASTSADVVVEGQAKVGNFTLSFIDLEAPVAGLPIQVIRTYDSRDKRRGDFGVGWRLSLKDVRLQENGTQGVNWQGAVIPGPFTTYCIQPTRDHIVTVTLPDNTAYKFRVMPSPQCRTLSFQVVNLNYVPLPGTNATLTQLDFPDPALVSGGFPGPIQLLDQNTLNLYDPNRYRLTLQDGRSFVISQRDGLQTVTDLNGNTLTFTQNGITHSAGKSVTFTRDPQGRITRITDPAGNPLKYAYDAAGDLVAFTDRENNTTTFRYDAAHYLLDIRDPRGIQPIRNEYDASGRLLRHIDAFGKIITYTHNLDTRQEVVTDRLGQPQVLEYDRRGNVVRETDALGNITLRTFDGRDNRTSETDPLGNTTRYAYDAQDNLLSVTDPLSNTTRYTYNSRQQVLTTIDPLGHAITNTYDAKGNLTVVTDTLGNATRYTYDARGNLLTQTDALTNTTTYAYDRFGNLSRQTDPLGVVTIYTYDNNGNRLTQTVTRTTPSGLEALTTIYVYDRQGRLTQTTDPDGTTTWSEYDALGKQSTTIDKLKRRTDYLYDELGQLEQTLYPDGTTEEFTYDAEGRRLTSTDRGGRTTVYAYDALGRLKQTTFPDGAFTTNDYDKAGRLIAATDALSNTTRYGYDAASRRTVITDSLGMTTTFAYDANGNQVAFTDALSNTTYYGYDALNRRIRTIFPDTTKQKTEYDALGRRIAETDQADNMTRFAYDALGQLITVTDALSQTTTYAYDEVGNFIRQTDALSHTTTFAYDKLGRQIRRTLPLGAFETMAYDAAGNLVRRTDFNGATITYAYDLNNRLTTRSYPDGSSVQFTYTPTGQRLTAADVRGTTTYAYDSRDRLVRLTYPDGRRLDYGYDAQGNRTILAALAGTTTLTTAYTYDALNRLATVIDPAGRVYTHTYDLNGNRESLRYPNGMVTTYSYDRLNHLTNLVTQRTTGALIQSYAYTLGPAGNRTRIDELGGTARAYTYDALYRLTQESIAGGSPYTNSFTYDAVGNRLTQTKVTSSGTALIGYTYDTRDRLLTENATNYAWDANGNLITKSREATYVWDFENRLIRVDKTDGTAIIYAYDADGNRVQTRTALPGGAMTATNDLVDPSGLLSQVVAETDGSGNLTAYYVRGDDLLAVMRGNQTRFYHADGLGSIRLLTDESGNTTDSYTFSAFGELLAHVGSDPNAYLFASEPLDPNSGFYYNRARWMDPGIGRFIRKDDFQGSILDSITLHKYLYAGADPANKLDPSGRFTFIEISIANFIRNVLATTQANIGFGVLDQVSYGGTQGLKSVIISSVTPIALTGAVVFAAKLFGRLARFGSRINIPSPPPSAGSAAASYSGFSPLRDVFEELATRRRGLGLPPWGSPANRSTLATLEVLEVGSFAGSNIRARQLPVNITLSVNFISETHAETEVIQHYLNYILSSGTRGRVARIVVDRPLCMPCHRNIESLAKQVGLDLLEIITPEYWITLDVVQGTWH